MLNLLPQSVLVICTRRIGDVLLTTPLIRSIRRAWPEAAIDALVFAGTEGVLQGNPDLRQVLTVPQRPAFAEHLRLALRLYRRYDLAVSTQTGDRPTLYAWLAGRTRIGLTDPARPSRLKTHMLHASLPFDNLQTHTVRMNLQLAELLGIDPATEVVAPADTTALSAFGLRGGADALPYVVLHPFPQYSYKQWHEEGWLAVSHWLACHGIRTVLTGSSNSEEMDYVSALASKMPPQTLNLAGRTTLAQAAAVIKGALAYVGPDTANTHLAAATGVPTLALFGPSNPVKWGPWPKNWPAHLNPYNLRGTQHRGNVTLLQGAGDCVPCLNEGCGQHRQSSSDCLTGLPADRVIQALAAGLGRETTSDDKPIYIFPPRHLA